VVGAVAPATRNGFPELDIGAPDFGLQLNIVVPDSGLEQLYSYHAIR